MELKKKLEQFLLDKRAAMGTQTILAIVSVVVVFILWLYVTPTVAYQIDYVIFHNASTWNFTAHEGAAAILGLGGFIWIAGGIVLLVGGVFSAIKWS
jgi:hypothetical protein